MAGLGIKIYLYKVNHIYLFEVKSNKTLDESPKEVIDEWNVVLNPLNDVVVDLVVFVEESESTILVLNPSTNIKVLHMSNNLVDYFITNFICGEECVLDLVVDKSIVYSCSLWVQECDFDEKLTLSSLEEIVMKYGCSYMELEETYDKLMLV